MQEITSRKNPVVQHLRKLAKDRAYREACGEFLCDGQKLYEEAVRCGVEIILVVSSDPKQKVHGQAEQIFMPQDILESISAQQSPQTLLFSCKMPKQTPQEQVETALVLDNIQDPGNLGTLIRTARAFAIDQVILTGNTADLYNPKTIRSTMGTLFCQSICQMEVDEIKNYVNQMGLTLYGAALGQNSQKAGTGFLGKTAIAIGNEGNGLSKEILEICEKTIEIPMQAGVESLNAAVAGSILMWERYREKIK